MINVKVHSRRIFLGAAFVGAMAGTGALFGFMGGLMLVLLSHAVLRSDGATLSVLLVSGALGVTAATIWSVLLVTRQSSRTLAWNPTVPTPQANEGN